MSTTWKVILIVLILAIIAFVVFHKRQAGEQAMEMRSNAEPALTTSSSDNSNEALNKDLGSVDAQMSALDADNAGADAGLSQSN